MSYRTVQTDDTNEARLRAAMTPRAKDLPPNSVNGVPSRRRAYPGRDESLARGVDPLSRTSRPAGT